MTILPVVERMLTEHLNFIMNYSRAGPQVVVNNRPGRFIKAREKKPGRPERHIFTRPSLF